MYIEHTQHKLKALRKKKWVIRIVFEVKGFQLQVCLNVNDVSYFGTNGLVPLMVRTVMNKTDLFKELEEYLRFYRRKSNNPSNTGQSP